MCLFGAVCSATGLLQTLVVQTAKVDHGVDLGFQVGPFERSVALSEKASHWANVLLLCVFLGACLRFPRTPLLCSAAPSVGVIFI